MSWESIFICHTHSLSCLRETIILHSVINLGHKDLKIEENHTLGYCFPQSVTQYKILIKVLVSKILYITSQLSKDWRCFLQIHKILGWFFPRIIHLSANIFCKMLKFQKSQRKDLVTYGKTLITSCQLDQWHRIYKPHWNEHRNWFKHTTCSFKTIHTPP